MIVAYGKINELLFHFGLYFLLIASGNFVYCTVYGIVFGYVYVIVIFALNCRIFKYSVGA